MITSPTKLEWNYYCSLSFYFYIFFSEKENELTEKIVEHQKTIDDLNEAIRKIKKEARQKQQELHQ